MLWDESQNTLAISGQIDFNAQGSGENISGNGTDLTLASGNDIDLNATADVNIPVNVGLRFGDGAQHIETDNTDLTITSDVSINLSTPQVDLLVDTNFVTTGGVNGMSIDGTTFSVDGLNNRVGIGTAAPDMDLEIKKASANVTLKINAATAANDAQLQFATGDSADWLLQVDGSAANDPLHFYDYSTSSKVLTLNNGKVGIGTATPDHVLHLHHASTQCFLKIDSHTSTDAGISLSVDGSSMWSIFNDTVRSGGVANSLVFNDDGDERMCINQGNGYVGIGTAAPAGLLNLSSGTDDGTTLYFTNTDTSLSATDIIGSMKFQGYNTSASALKVGAEIRCVAPYTWTTHADDNPTQLEFWTNADGTGATAQVMTIAHDGKVGIGTTSPDYALEVEGSANNHTRILNIKGTGDSSSDSGGMLRLSCNDGAVMLTGQQLGRIDFMGADSASTEDMGASIYALANGNWDGDTNATDLIFATAPDVNDDALGSPQRRMTIDKDGDVGIGKATPDSRLHVLSSINGAAKATIHCECNEDGADAGDVLLWLDWSADTAVNATARWIDLHDQDGTIGRLESSATQIDQQFTQESDIRYKENIVDTALKGLETLNKIKVRDFEWNEKYGASKAGIKVTAGFIADELYEVYPAATKGTPGAVNDDGSIKAMGVMEGAFTRLLIKAVQELSAEVEKLKGN